MKLSKWVEFIWTVAIVVGGFATMAYFFDSLRSFY